MTSVYFGLFKQVFAATKELVAQMTTGTLTFDYVQIDTDDTNHLGFNNVYVNSTGIPKGNFVRSVVWVHPVTGSKVTTGYAYGRSYDTTLPDATLTPTYDARDLQAFVLVNGVFVAQLPSIPSSGGCGGVHIQTIAGVYYIVGYKLYSVSNWFKIERYRVVLDMEIDQSTITAMPLIDSITYTDRKGATFMGAPYKLTNNIGTEFLEYANYFPMQNRNVVCNNDGTKTVFFAVRTRLVDGDYIQKFFPVFELTDDGTTFALEELYELDMTDEVVGTDSYSDTTNYPVGTACLSEGPSCTAPVYNGINYGGPVAGSYTSTRNYAQTKVKTFLGVAYDRKTDDIIPAYCVKQNATSQKVGVGEHMERSVDGSVVNTINVNYTGFNNDYLIVIGDDEILYQTPSGFNYQFTHNGLGYQSTGSYYQKYLSNFDLNVVDLSCRIILTVERINEKDNFRWNATTSKYNIDIKDSDYYKVIDYDTPIVLEEVIDNESVGLLSLPTASFSGTQIYNGDCCVAQYSSYTEP